MNIEDKIKLIVAALEDVKAQEITVLDTGKLTSLFELANIAVAERPGARLMQSDAIMEPLKSEVLQRQSADGTTTGQAGSVLLRATPPLDISATAIRDILARHGSARYLLPDAVLDYIHEHQLYTHHEH